MVENNMMDRDNATTGDDTMVDADRVDPLPGHSNFDQNLDDSFIESVQDEDDTELEQSAQMDEEVGVYFYRHKRVSCFAHNLMLVVRKVSCN